MTQKSHLARFGGVLAASTLLLTACGDDNADGGEETEAEDVGTLDAEFVTIAAGGSSGPYYQIGATMADMLADDLDSDTSVQATGASAENINMIADGDAELAFVMGDAAVQATEGTGPFEDDPRDDLMAIMTMYPNTVQLVATSASGIESVEDLEDANVAVGDVGSGVELNAQMVLEAHGITYDDINEDYLSYEEATDQMANGHIDAAFVTSGLPNPTLVELGTNTDFTVVPIEGEGAEALLDEHDFFSEDVIPADTYDQDEDIPTVGVTNHLLVSSELSEEAAYDITAAFFEDLDRLHDSHAAAEQITLESATEGLVVPLHPGAEQYFEEQGAETE